MKCHENNKNNKGGQNHSPLKHMLHMVLCCGLPIVILSFLPLITKFSQSTGSVIARIVPFICPIMMIGMMVMMVMMFGGNKKSSCCDKSNNENNKALELDKTIE